MHSQKANLYFVIAFALSIQTPFSLSLCVSLKALWQIPIYGFQLDLFLPKNLSGILSVDIKLKYWNLLSIFGIS